MASGEKRGEGQEGRPQKRDNPPGRLFCVWDKRNTHTHTDASHGQQASWCHAIIHSPAACLHSRTVYQKLNPPHLLFPKRIPLHISSLCTKRRIHRYHSPIAQDYHTLPPHCDCEQEHLDNAQSRAPSTVGTNQTIPNFPFSPPSFSSNSSAIRNGGWRTSRHCVSGPNLS